MSKRIHVTWDSTGAKYEVDIVAQQIWVVYHDVQDYHDRRGILRKKRIPLRERKLSIEQTPRWVIKLIKDWKYIDIPDDDDDVVVVKSNGPRLSPIQKRNADGFTVVEIAERGPNRIHIPNSGSYDMPTSASMYSNMGLQPVDYITSIMGKVMRHGPQMFVIPMGSRKINKRDHLADVLE